MRRLFPVAQPDRRSRRHPGDAGLVVHFAVTAGVTRPRMNAEGECDNWQPQTQGLKTGVSTPKCSGSRTTSAVVKSRRNSVRSMRTNVTWRINPFWSRRSLSQASQSMGVRCFDQDDTGRRITRENCD